MSKQAEPKQEQAVEPVVQYANIHTAIVGIYEKVSYVQKKKHGDGLRYTFASEADLIRALRPKMEEAGVYMSVVDYVDVERVVGRTSGDKPTNITTCKAIVRFTHAPSQTFIDTKALGEGSDGGDKSGNKAMTCAFKYAMRQTFCIETGDDPDVEQDKQHDNGKNTKRQPPKVQDNEARRRLVSRCEELVSQNRSLRGLCFDTPDWQNTVPDEQLRKDGPVLAKRMTKDQYMTLSDEGLTDVDLTMTEEQAAAAIAARTPAQPETDKGFDEP